LEDTEASALSHENDETAEIEATPAETEAVVAAAEAEKPKKEKFDFRRRMQVKELEQKERELTRAREDYIKLSIQYAEMKDRYLRLAAEMENFRKRLERDFSNRVESTIGGLMAEFLPVMDDLERFFVARQELETAETKDGEALAAGARLIYQNVSKILQNRGVKAMETVDHEFDPNRHDALLQMPVAGKAPNRVVQENTKGYLFFDKVLRPAKVIVSA
jgi:molecular chaperone GrpE